MPVTSAVEPGLHEPFVEEQVIATAPPAAPNTATTSDWEHDTHSCATNPMWGLDYAFVGAALWLGAQAGRTLRRRR
jgi:hypothetical protein